MLNGLRPYERAVVRAFLARTEGPRRFEAKATRIYQRYAAVIQRAFRLVANHVDKGVIA